MQGACRVHYQKQATYLQQCSIVRLMFQSQRQGPTQVRELPRLGPGLDQEAHGLDLTYQFDQPVI